MKYFDEEDAITEYEKQLQKKDNEIERLKEEYVMLQNASDEVEEKLIAESTKWESKFYDEAKKVDKAIDYIEQNDIMKVSKEEKTKGSIFCDKELLDILKGSDKE